MILIGTKLGDNYAWEISLFHKIRNFSDGISFGNITAKLDTYKGDHNPKFILSVELLNFCIGEFIVYNRHHCEDGETEGFKCPGCGVEIRLEN